MKNIDNLISGFQRFQDKYFHPDNSLYEQLKKGQKPNVLLIGCSDSRVDPAILTDCWPGDLFVVRNVANLVPPHEEKAAPCSVISAVEYAVKVLGVENIIVKGHSNCGGIDTLLHGSDDSFGEFIGPWIRMAHDTCERVYNQAPERPVEERRRACEMAVVRLSLESLRSYPWIAEKVGAGTLHLHGWYFDLAAGELLGLNPDTDAFEVLVTGVRKD